MSSLLQKELIARLAKKHGITESAATEMWYLYNDAIIAHIENTDVDDMDNVMGIRMKRIGTFIPRPRVIESKQSNNNWNVNKL